MVKKNFTRKELSNNIFKNIGYSKNFSSEIVDNFLSDYYANMLGSYFNGASRGDDCFPWYFTNDLNDISNYTRSSFDHTHNIFKLMLKSKLIKL